MQLPLRLETCVDSLSLALGSVRRHAIVQRGAGWGMEVLAGREVSLQEDDNDEEDVRGVLLERGLQTLLPK